MIETAIADGDAATVAAVLKVVPKTAPESAADLDRLEAGYRSKQAQAKSDARPQAQRRLAAAGPLELWTGEAELGGSRSTGSSDELRLFAVLKLARPGVVWTQNFAARADYAQSAHAATTERAVATYQRQLRLSADSYGYGLGESEHDRFLGYKNRYTLGVGAGLKAIDRPDLDVELDLGPALRAVNYYARADEVRLAGRASATMAWTARPDLKISEEAAVYLDRSHTTARSTLAVDTDLFGPLKARLSYNVQYERDAPIAHRQIDTVTRAGLVYGF